MLAELRIRNFAIIEDLEIAFEPGFNVVTGETGAGKTMLMRALGSLLGARGGADLIRDGAPEAEIEALFTGPEVAAVRTAERDDAEALPVEGYEDRDDGAARDDAPELTVRRVIAPGRQRAYVDDRLVTSARLATLAARLVHVYGQHEHHTLLEPRAQRAIVDAAGGLGDRVATMAARFRDLTALEERLRAVREGAAGIAARRELLAHQVAELAAAAFQAGEVEQLEREREVLRHAERLRAAAGDAEQALYAGDASVLDTVTRHATRLAALGAIDAELGEAARLLDEARPALEEAALRLGARLRALAVDPERLERVEERIALARRLARKYQCGVDELAARHAAATRELAELADDADPAALARQLEDAAVTAWEAADVLSAARRTTSAALGARITAGLRELALGGATLAIVLEPVRATADMPEARRRGEHALELGGAERAVFEFAPNAGEAPRPLARIASGGELSRVMLALKAATAGTSDVATLLFDEVDAGIGGAVAEVVGRKLAALAHGRQVICITHLPQIAACADHHFVVRKRAARGRTRSSAERLSDRERVEELARMLGGVTVTTKARQHAAELRRLGRRGSHA
jgi:DNA repair protein RecN (Recombination protein N)